MNSGRVHGFAGRFVGTAWSLATLFVAFGPCVAGWEPPTKAPASGGDGGWIDLMDRTRWKTPQGNWFEAGDAKIAQDKPKLLVGVDGKGVLINGPIGRTTNLVTKESFGDVEVSMEFLVPKGSNSGIKFEGLYEIQIFDSFGATKLKGSDNGGIYPRAELLPKYHHIDEGIAPRTNASKAPGTWQTLTIKFRAPRFEGEKADGKKPTKTANARLESVVLNGVTIHENQELLTPTGHAYVLPEVPRGPLLLQADHGPVAFRALRARHLPPSK